MQVVRTIGLSICVLAACPAVVSAGCGGSSQNDWVNCGGSDGIEVLCLHQCPTQYGADFTCELVAADGGPAVATGGSVTGGGATGMGGSGSSSASTPGDGGDTTQCLADASVCGSTCVNLANDNAHCGSCDTGCDGGTACVNAICTSTDPNLLAYHIVDASYSRTIDRVVIASDTPSSVHLLDAHTMNDIALTLPSTPTSVTVSPDGKHAAVGHDAFVSYIDLVAGTVLNTFPVNAPIGDVALTDAGYVYAFPSSDQWVSLYILDTATGAVTTTGNIYAGSRGAVSADDQTLFYADDLDPSSLYKESIASPAAPAQGQMLFGATYESCDRIWVSGDGSLLYTGCGNVFHASDLSYAGSLPSVTTVLSSDDHTPDGTVAALVASTGTVAYTGAGALQVSEVQLFTAMYLQPTGTLALPPLAAPGGGAASNGLFVFHDAAGTGTIVLLHASDPVSHADVYGVAVL